MLIINLTNTRHKAVEHRRRKLWRRVTRIQRTAFLPPWNLEGERLVAGARKDPRVRPFHAAAEWRPRGTQGAPNMGQRSVLHQEPSQWSTNPSDSIFLSLSFPSSSPSILFPLFVIYSLRLILSIFLIFSFSFLPLYFIRGEGNRRRRRNVRQSYQVALSLLLSREADGVVSMNDA